MKKILIIEDEKEYSDILKTQLEAKSFLVSQAYDGLEGYTKARTEQPDLIVLDIRMPVMNGLDMLELLKKEQGVQKLNVIVLTNIEPDADMTRRVINDQPLYYYIKSDINLNDLVAKIVDLMG